MSNSYTPKKPYNISETKLKRIIEYNDRLKEQLELARIPVSEASARYSKNYTPPFNNSLYNSLVEYCNSTRDPLVPSIWGPVSKEQDPFAPAAGGNNGSSGCCTIM